MPSSMLLRRSRSSRRSRRSLRRTVCASTRSAFSPQLQQSWYTRTSDVLCRVCMLVSTLACTPLQHWPRYRNLEFRVAAPRPGAAIGYSDCIPSSSSYLKGASCALGNSHVDFVTAHDLFMARHGAPMLRQLKR